jgi:PIN domain nuclease of toxin-antitoxin system
MRYLIDTHTLLWYLDGSHQLSMTARSMIDDQNISVYVSIINFWEIAVKQSIGKLDCYESVDTIYRKINDAGVQIIELKMEHLIPLTALPFHHRDPFDRLLVATCKVENFIFVSQDSVFKEYQVEVIW